MLSIEIRPDRDLNLGMWAFSWPILLAGETATITNILVADGARTLYEITKSDGSTFACYRQWLVDAGALEPMEN